MSRWTLPEGLGLLLVALLIVTVWIVIDQDSAIGRRDYGCDFRQFYAAGLIVSSPQRDRLYDQPYFRDVQCRLLGAPSGFYSLYPPTLALAMVPFAWLPYDTALAAWWAVQAVCFAGAAWLLMRTAPLPKQWRAVALLALACMFPVWLAVRTAHLTALLLLVMTGGFAIHGRGRRLAAGLVLSVLAVKPQFAAAIGLWLLLRRDWRTIAGMALGGAAQLGAVALCLGPDILLRFIENLPVIARSVKSVLFSPVYEQSFAGIVGNRLWHVGCDPRQYGNWFLLMQLAVSATAGWLLFRVVQAGAVGRVSPIVPISPIPPIAPIGDRLRTSCTQTGRKPVLRHEYAAVVLFVLLLTPYLLAYDLTLLAIPIVCLWSSPGWRMGTALYLALTVAAALAYLAIGFSLVPFLELVVLGRIAAATAGWRGIGRLNLGGGVSPRRALPQSP